MKKSFEAYTFVHRCNEIYFIEDLVDECTMSDALKILIEKVRATKCVKLYNRNTDKFDFDVILDPEKYSSLKGQMINPYSRLTKEERKAFARIINLKGCIIRVNN